MWTADKGLLMRSPNDNAAACLLLIGVWTIIILIVLAIFTPSDAAVSPQTRAACTNSYLAYCGHTTPGTPQCRACFRSNWKRLDAQCQSAIKVDPAYKHNFSKKRR